MLELCLKWCMWMIHTFELLNFMNDTIHARGEIARSCYPCRSRVDECFRNLITRNLYDSSRADQCPNIPDSRGCYAHQISPSALSALSLSHSMF